MRLTMGVLGMLGVICPGSLGLYAARHVCADPDVHCSIVLGDRLGKSLSVRCSLQVAPGQREDPHPV